MGREWLFVYFIFFFQAEDGIRDLVRSRGLGDVYKRQAAHGLERAVDQPEHHDDGDRDTGTASQREQGDGLSLIHI